MEDKRRSGFSELAKESVLYPQESPVRIQSSSKGFKIGLPKEISFQEKRIILTPDAVKVLSENGHEIWVEKGAGLGSWYTDQQYSEAGARIVDTAEEVFKCEAILKIEPPTLEEVERFTSNQIVISAFQMGNQTPEYIRALCRKRVTAMGFEFIEDKKGGIPIIRAMSEIAGVSVVQIAAELLSKGKGKIMGGITGVEPTKVVIIGAGTAAENAARAAMGLGAMVMIYDNHLYKLRRIKKNIGQHVFTSTMDTISLSDSIRNADVVIGALRPDKGVNRFVVTEEMVASMKEGSVVIDLSIDQGGCIETAEMTTLKNPTYKKFDIIHYCVPNVNSRLSRTTTQALSNMFTPTILRAGEEGGMDDMIFKHNWFMKGVYTYKGALTNEFIARKFGMKYKNLALLLAARF